jgi:hypothetical protein
MPKLSLLNIFGNELLNSYLPLEIELKVIIILYLHQTPRRLNHLLYSISFLIFSVYDLCSSNKSMLQLFSSTDRNKKTNEPCQISCKYYESYGPCHIFSPMPWYLHSCLNFYKIPLFRQEKGKNGQEY